ncbi:MAG TPA: AMP-binding protein [Steroidobacteraceae bacterium]|nr:AMP-binding protein [Steroidobacteraceae bacterium]
MPSAIWTLVRIIRQRRIQERSGRWTRTRLQAHQQARLADLRRFVLRASPFYARFHKALEARPFGDLPVLSKATLMEEFDQLVTDRSLRLAELESYLNQPQGELYYRGRYIVLSTSGSTGRRGVFVYSRDEWLAGMAALTRPISWQRSGGSRRPQRGALIASGTWWHYSARAGAALNSKLLPIRRIDAAAPLSQIVAQLNEWQPVGLAAYPSVLRQLVQEQSAGRLRIALRNIATSAEVLTEEDRRAAQRAWGARLYDTYGATEYAPIASECAFGHRHLFENGALIEIVDRHGRAVPDGEPGEQVLLTVFDRRVQPLIRYALSDVVRILPGECECGRPYRMIERIEGRIEDVLQFARRDDPGARVPIHPNIFHQELERVPASGWQVIQRGDALSVNLLELRDEAVVSQLPARLRAVLESRNARVSEITVQRVAQLQRGASGKAPLIRSLESPG